MLLKLLIILHTVFQGCRHNLSSCVCFLVLTSAPHQARHIHGKCKSKEQHKCLKNNNFTVSLECMVQYKCIIATTV